MVCLVADRNLKAPGDVNSYDRPYGRAHTRAVFTGEDESAGNIKARTAHLFNHGAPRTASVRSREGSAYSQKRS